MASLSPEACRMAALEAEPVPGTPPLSAERLCVTRGSAALSCACQALAAWLPACRISEPARECGSAAQGREVPVAVTLAPARSSYRAPLPGGWGRASAPAPAVCRAEQKARTQDCVAAEPPSLASQASSGTAALTVQKVNSVLCLPLSWSNPLLNEPSPGSISTWGRVTAVSTWRPLLFRGVWGMEY